MNGLPGKPREKKRRLFFALWPDDAVRVHLARAARDWTPRPVPVANLHCTLVFLGSCTQEQYDCAREAASGVSFEAFELQLDYLGTWSRSGVQWLGASQVPEELQHLQARLQKALEACGFEPERRRFVPHVTLARKVAKPVVRSGLEPLLWRVADFVLAESVSGPGGVEYRVLERWRAE